MSFFIYQEFTKLTVNRPRGKESTEVRKSQIKGKESENSYQELKRSQKSKYLDTVSVCLDRKSVV